MNQSCPWTMVIFIVLIYRLTLEGLGATLNVAKPQKGSSVAIFGLGAVGLAVSDSFFFFFFFWFLATVMKNLHWHIYLYIFRLLKVRELLELLGSSVLI